MTCRDPRQATEELGIFRTFLNAYPSLATEIVKITQPCQPFPDITVKLQSGSETDFELGEWLEEKQMQRRKKLERLEALLSDALGEQRSNESKYFRCVMVIPKDPPVRFNPGDGPAFKSELYTLIEETDHRWPSERFWHSPQGRVCRNFESYLTLGKYLASVHFDPLQFGNTNLEPWPAGQPWIFFSAWISSYSSETALKALLKIIEKKRTHYGSQEARHVRLLIHYGRAVRYNTPYYGIGVHGFEDVATVAARVLNGKPLIFEKVYLLEALEPGVQAFEIYPNLQQCR